MNKDNRLLQLISFAKMVFFSIFGFFIGAGKPIYIRVLRWCLIPPIALILLIVGIQFNLFWLFGSNPVVNRTSNPPIPVASEIYSADGALMGKYFYENRSILEYSEISPKLIKTLVSTEDERFYSHHGVDVQGLAGVFFDAVRGKGRGGSTLTQQLVKNMYKTREAGRQGIFSHIPIARMLIIKLREGITSVRLEKMYSKNEILAMYLNTVDFGNNAYGIASASQTYFGKKAKDLDWDEAAILVGMLKATTNYSPTKNPAKCKERRNVVLGKLAEAGLLSSAEAEEMKSHPLRLSFSVENPYAGKAQYFRMAVMEQLKPWLKEHKLDIYSSGLKIYTSLDTAMQRYAEEAIAKNMQRLQNLFEQHWKGQNPWVDENNREIPGFIDRAVVSSDFFKEQLKASKGDSSKAWAEVRKPRKTRLFDWKRGGIDTVLSFYDEIRATRRLLHTGFVAMDPRSGDIKAYVGDISFDYFKYDNVSQSRRQPGSTFKPFTYVAAMENGLGPCDTYTDHSVSISYEENGIRKSWAPHNADFKNTGTLHTLKNAMSLSLNTITVQVAKAIGFRKVNEYAQKLGIESPLDTFPSTTLGSSDVSLLELTRAYAPFVNGGYRINPVFVTKITDQKGNVLFEAKREHEKVLTDEGLFYMTQMFRGTTSEYLGTTQALFQYDIFKPKIEIAGKTGTSSNHSDGWFVGISPKLIAGSWVGGTERSIHFRTGALGEGCKTALPNFGLFMQGVLNDRRYDSLLNRFSPPEIRAKKPYTCHTPPPPRASITDSAALLLLPDSLPSTLGDPNLDLFIPQDMGAATE